MVGDERYGISWVGGRSNMPAGLAADFRRGADHAQDGRLWFGQGVPTSPFQPNYRWWPCSLWIIPVVKKQGGGRNFSFLRGADWSLCFTKEIRLIFYWIYSAGNIHCTPFGQRHNIHAMVTSAPLSDDNISQKVLAPNFQVAGFFLVRPNWDWNRCQLTIARKRCSWLLIRWYRYRKKLSNYEMKIPNR